MILIPSGLPGGPLGGLLGRLGGLLGALEASWAVLESSWSHLGRLGAILAVLEANLEAILGQRGHLGGHLGAVWDGKTLGNHLWAILPRPRRDEPKRQGEFF